jgi:hypothetical protein
MRRTAALALYVDMFPVVATLFHSQAKNNSEE